MDGAGREGPLEDEIRRYYDAGLEGGRLFAGSGPLELARTQDVLERHLPAAPARVLDVGGATGVYARWLAAKGYEVHLSDPVERHLEEARCHPGPAPASIRPGDARALPEADLSADAVVMLGPLYHLTERADRLRALGEGRRVLRPGGVLVAAAISRYASLLDGLARGFIDDPEFVPILERDLREGQHRNPTPRLEYFTTAFFHVPSELESEATDAGLIPEAVLAVEGPAWLMADLEARWRDEARRRPLLDLLRRVEGERELLAASAHLLLIARRP
ncbi:MAG TPA: class I SAM-dependent methyltransferase [Vicinamibacteria bacterium]|nr:class I SAM-dependent methyltransferase [Vicinamibacteria bacterium]